MQTRKFGRLGWPVSEVGYGLWGMGGWTGSDDASRWRPSNAVDLGCTFFDTALAYGDGKSEQMLGQVLDAPPRQAARRRHQDSAEEPAVAGAAELRAGRRVSADHIRRGDRDQPDEPRRRSPRPPAVPRLDRRVGRRRSLAAGRRRPEASGPHPRLRHQRQPVGADQRPQGAARRASSTACRSSTTSSTRTRRTSCSRCAANWASRSSRACRSTRAA